MRQGAKVTITETADIEVVCPGMLDVLSVGKGDLKITVGCDDPEEKERGRVLIEELLRKGYTIFVETDEGLARVTEFNPNRFTYIINELAGRTDDEETTAPPAAVTQTKKAPGRRVKVVKKEIPVAGSKATAIGKTAGG
jgi:hypothetical protein